MSANRPGGRLLAILSHVTTSDTLERIVVPVIADLVVEMADARGRGAVRRVWVFLRGHVALARALVMHSVTPPYRQACGERSHISSVTLGCALIFTAMLVAAPLRGWHEVIGEERIALAIALLLPQALGAAIPLSVLFGVALGTARLRQSPSPNITTTPLGIGAVAMVVTLMMTWWVIPAANNTFRIQVQSAIAERASRADVAVLVPAKGLNEMSGKELSAAISLARWQDPSRVPTMVFTRHVRTSLAVACLVLAAAGLAVARLAGRHLCARGALALMVTVGYYALFLVGRRWVTTSEVSPALAAWTANGVFLVLSVAALAFSLSRQAPPASSSTTER